MDDITALLVVGLSGFFVALSFVLLARYRQVSQQISASSDLGRDLWQALDMRLKKQDERILDMMGRVEVVQARLLGSPAVREPTVQVPTPPPPAAAPLKRSGVEESEGVAPRSESQPRSQKSQTPKPESELDETQLAAIKLLSENPKNTRQLTDALGKSREHTARMMKELFDRGLVRRNDSAKPFVYQLTDEGRRYLSSGA